MNTITISRRKLQGGTRVMVLGVVVALLAMGGIAYVAVGGFGSDSGTSGTATSTAKKKSDKAEQLPDWYNDEFPVYPKARLSHVSHNEKHSPNRYLVAYSTAVGHEDEIAAWMKQAYSSNGWSIHEGGASRFTAQKKGYDAVLGIAGSKYVTVITVTAYRDDPES